MMWDGMHFLNGGQFISEGVWRHPDRVIDSYELIYVLSGVVRLSEAAEDGAEETRYDLHPGELLCLFPGRRHYGTADTRDTAFYWLHFTAPAAPAVKHCRGDRHPLSLYFRQLLHVAQTPGYDPLAAEYLLRLIVMEATHRETVPAGPGALCARAEEYVRLHPENGWRAAGVAAALGYNTDYLSRQFKRAYGLSLKQWLDQQRLNRARSLLLSTEQPLSEVAAACGFAEYKAFLKFFVYHAGMTPSELRRSCYRTHINHH